MTKLKNFTLAFILLPAMPAILSGCAQEQYLWKKSGATQSDG